MKILVTGATGFIGKNLISQIKKNSDFQILEAGSKTSEGELATKTIEADFIVHLAGVNRPKDLSEFYSGNSALTKTIVDTLNKKKKKTPIIFTSSIHATLNSDFGRSKRLAEETIIKYGEEAGAPVYIFRLTNTFGRWAKVGEHSVVANFCYNISHKKEITILNPEAEIEFLYINDVVKCFIDIINGIKNKITEEVNGFLKINKTTKIKLINLANLLIKFNNEDYRPQNQKNEFEKNLYQTFMSYKNNDL